MPVWAVPKTKDGKIDHHQALSGDDLKELGVIKSAGIW